MGEEVIKNCLSCRYLENDDIGNICRNNDYYLLTDEELTEEDCDCGYMPKNIVEQEMNLEYAIRLLHPETSAQEIAAIKYYGGFESEEAAIQAVNHAIEIVCEAAAKQIPQKPITKENGVRYCPHCGDRLTFADIVLGFKHCNKCGQAISWEAE